eukprot:Polyplicarium_translucidae@DN3051_c0_g1_i1.p1
MGATRNIASDRPVFGTAADTMSFDLNANGVWRPSLDKANLRSLFDRLRDNVEATAECAVILPHLKYLDVRGCPEFREFSSRLVCPNLCELFAAGDCADFIEKHGEILQRIVVNCGSRDSQRRREERNHRRDDVKAVTERTLVLPDLKRLDMLDSQTFSELSSRIACPNLCDLFAVGDCRSFIEKHMATLKRVAIFLGQVPRGFR